MHKNACVPGRTTRIMNRTGEENHPLTIDDE